MKSMKRFLRMLLEELWIYLLMNVWFLIINVVYNVFFKNLLSEYLLSVCKLIV